MRSMRAPLRLVPAMSASRFTAAEKATCAEREVRQRERVYARLVAAGRMSPDEAAKQIDTMAEIAAEYRAQAEAEAAKERLL